MKYRKTLIVIALATLALSLTGCDQRGARDVDGIKKQAEFVKVCEASGGDAGYDVWGNQSCEFEAEVTR